MKKVFQTMTMFLIMGTWNVNAQVRIGSDAEPNPSAILDLNKSNTENANTMGLALPRVSLSSLTTKIHGADTPPEGMLVYNTNTTTGVGLYYWKTNTWVKIGEGGNLPSGTTVNQVLKWNGTAWAVAAVDSTMIADGALSGTDLANNAITTTKIRDLNVTTVKIAANAVDSTKIKDLAVGQQDLAPNSVNTSKILNNAVTVAKLPAGATATSFLRGDGTWVTPTDNNTTYTGSTSITLNGTSFQRAALTGDVTSAANTNTTTIAANVIDSTKIKNLAVGQEDLAPNSVNSSKILDGTIVAADLASNAVTNVKIANAAVDSAKIASNAVKTIHINNNAVTSAKIADGAVTLAKIAASVIDSTKIKNLAIGQEDLAPNSVNTSKILNNAVTVAKLPAGATATSFLRGDGTWVTPTDNNTIYTGSTSITLSGTSFQRAALTGDVTATANTNATTIAANAVTSAKIADGTIVAADLAAGVVNNAALTANINGASQSFTANSATAVNLGTIYAPTAAGTNGYLLVSNGSGAPAWKAVDTAIPVGTVVNGILENSGLEVDLANGSSGYFYANNEKRHTAHTYLGQKITLNKGVWEVFVGAVIEITTSHWLANQGRAIWARTSLSSSSSGDVRTGFSFHGNDLVSGMCIQPMKFGKIEGSFLINVTADNTVLYYRTNDISFYQAAAQATSEHMRLNGSGYGENYIHAIRLK
ncbi:hypothetical protein FACS189413_14940 [Bacteroidia bacterium]|nr:hypothetical protein FACS189413_14940 [Bacteroidia bacterium]